MALIAEPDSATAGAHTAAAGTIHLGVLFLFTSFTGGAEKTDHSA